MNRIIYHWLGEINFFVNIILIFDFVFVLINLLLKLPGSLLVKTNSNFGFLDKYIEIAKRPLLQQVILFLAHF